VDPADGGLTVLEGIILCIVAVMVAVFAVHALNAPPGHPAGFVYSAFEETGGCLMVSGEVYGYALAGGTVDGVDLISVGPTRYGWDRSPAAFASSSAIWGASIWSRAVVEIATRDGAERLARTAETPVWPGNWMIVGTEHMIPFRQVDGDTLLEPGERFDLLLYPARSLAPGEKFLIRIVPPGAVPFTVERHVPPRITPVMNLG
jgi:hypothetical protein